MKKRLTVTIGIPAHNEAQNIGQLLLSLTEQNQKGFVIKQILVHSDASSDKTDAIVKRLRAETVTLHRHSKRIGKPAITNRLFTESDADILIILDADVLIGDKDFVGELIRPIISQKADLTAAKVIALPPKTLVEKVLAFSTDMKADMFAQINHGNSIYTCHGRARAFSKQFYKVFESKASIVADDAYSFLICKRLGLKYRYAPAAAVFYRLPQTLEDHLHQSRRFFQAQQQLKAFFDPKTLTIAYQLPLKVILTTTLAHCFRSPLMAIGYMGMLTLAKFQSISQTEISSQWPVATSSKVLT
jgi:cellulose synthase/poly-beta-1,6-N-acetylglucosamine synthase-like glycosyltransferase